MIVPVPLFVCLCDSLCVCACALSSSLFIKFVWPITTNLPCFYCFGQKQSKLFLQVVVVFMLVPAD